jgi:hypothetical protein
MTGRIAQVLRYLGVNGQAVEQESPAAAQLKQEARQLLTGLDTSIVPKTLYRVFSLRRDAAPGSYSLLNAEADPVLTLSGRLAESMLPECTHAALLLCTLGLPFDGLLRTQQARSMAKAALLDACGSVLVEEACDRAEDTLRSRYPGLYLTDRFSPGYGDLPLSLQPLLLHALDAEKQAGVYLTDSCLMNPSKTVTAIVGLSPLPQRAKIRGCGFCSFREKCTFRKDGKRCDSL